MNFLHFIWLPSVLKDNRRLLEKLLTLWQIRWCSHNGGKTVEFRECCRSDLSLLLAIVRHCANHKLDVSWQYRVWL